VTDSWWRRLNRWTTPSDPHSHAAKWWPFYAAATVIALVAAVAGWLADADWAILASLLLLALALTAARGRRWARVQNNRDA